MNPNMRQPRLALLLTLVALTGLTAYAYRTSAKWRNAIAARGEARATEPATATLATGASVTLASPAQSGGSYNIVQSVVAGGGGTSSNGATSVTGTVGQSVTASSSGGTYTLGGGFWGGNSSCPTITVSPTNATLPAGRAGSPYSQTFTQSGGSGSVTFTVSAGALPAGLTLSTGGVLSGSPTVFGTFNFTVRATDSNLCTGERAYTLLVNPPCNAITVSPTSLPNGTQSTSYSQTLTATGGTSPYTFAVTAGSLPNGLTLGGGGALTGTPTATGTFNFTVTVTDNIACTGTRAYTVIVSGCAIALTPAGRNFSSAAASSTVAVTALSCAWTATSNAAWLTLTNATSGSGNATLNYNLAANTGASRTGTISVNGVTHTVIQATADATQDTDGDGIPDSVEIIEGRNPLVKDNDIFTSNPISNRLFVMQQYRDFLGREGDPDGITNWVNALNANTHTRAQVIESFFNSTEFQNTGAPIVRLYFACFLRIPDYAGLQNWINAYRGGMTLDAIANAFVTSPEFLQTYGNLNNTAFVTLVYNNVLGRAPDPDGLTNWVNALNNGMSRGTLMTNFSESPEYKNRIGNSVYVTMMYVGMLRRSPDQTGFNNWVAFLNQGNSGLNLINQFIVAQEYHNRFLP